MSKGIGARQTAILDVLRVEGCPMVSVDLVVRTWNLHHESGTTIPYSFYESTRRAAVALVSKGLLLSGKPEFPPNGRLRAKVVFWLPGQEPPELARPIPRALFEHGVLKALTGGPRSYADVVYEVGSHLTNDRYEYDRLRGSISLAVRRLAAGGRIRRYMGAVGLREVEMLSVGM